MKGFQFDRCKAAEAVFPVSLVRELLDYEPHTGILRWRARSNRNFTSRYAGTEAGACHRSGAIQIQLSHDGSFRLFWAHRIAWAHFYGEWPDGLVDHEDGENQNNRISNLRVTDGSGNGSNKHVVQGGVPFRGVYRWPDGRFAAQIKKDGCWKWLGLHTQVEAAARAYDKAAVELHGDFASTNRSLGLFLRPSARALL